MVYLILLNCIIKIVLIKIRIKRLKKRLFIYINYSQAIVSYCHQNSIRKLRYYILILL